MRKVYKILIGKHEEKRLDISRRRWEYNITMECKDTEWDGVVWIHIVQDRGQWRAVLKTAMNLSVP